MVLLGSNLGSDSERMKSYSWWMVYSLHLTRDPVLGEVLMLRMRNEVGMS